MVKQIRRFHESISRSRVPKIARPRKPKAPPIAFGRVSAKQVGEWLEVRNKRQEMRKAFLERNRQQRANAVRKRVLAMWGRFLPRLRAAKSYREYRAIYSEYSTAVKKKLGKNSSQVLSQLAREGLIFQHGIPKQFYTGHFATEGDAALFIEKNKGYVIDFLRKRYHVHTTAQAVNIADEITPMLIEGLMRYNPKKGTSEVTHLQWWIRAAMTKRFNDFKRKTLSLDHPWRTSAKRPGTFKDNIEALPLDEAGDISTYAGKIVNVMNRLSNRDAQIFALHLQGFTPPEIAGAFTSPFARKKGQSVRDSTIRMALLRIAREIRS